MNQIATRPAVELFDPENASGLADMLHQFLLQPDDPTAQGFLVR
mgnify:CR=1 FL=1